MASHFRRTRQNNDKVVFSLTILLYTIPTIILFLLHQTGHTGLRSTVGNVSGLRCVSDSNSRGPEFNPGWVSYFLGDDHEIISTVILLPSTDSFKKGVVSYKRKYVHELLVIPLFKPAQEKVWLGEQTVPQ